jgi:hypothetical protein
MRAGRAYESLEGYARVESNRSGNGGAQAFPVHLRASPRADAPRYTVSRTRPEGGRVAVPIRDEPAESS